MAVGFEVGAARNPARRGQHPRARTIKGGN
jgi:hypothetical protein